jgi:hypothetical protein
MTDLPYAAKTKDVLTPLPLPSRDAPSAHFAPHVTAALKELYIVSSAAAQRGTHALDVRDAQWTALDRGTRQAQAVIDQLLPEYETQALTLLRNLASKCDNLLDHRIASKASPTALWRDVAKLGREAYEHLDLLASDRA